MVIYEDLVNIYFPIFKVEKRNLILSQDFLSKKDKDLI